jgi:hypothetical protein
MKKLFCVGFVSILLAIAAPASPSDGSDRPASFASHEEAARYVAGLFAGGRIDDVALGGDHYFVLIQHGSGLPIIGLAQIYRQEGERWRRVSQAPIPRHEFLRAVADKGSIVAVGESTGRKTLLYDPKKG